MVRNSNNTTFFYPLLQSFFFYSFFCSRLVTYKPAPTAVSFLRLFFLFIYLYHVEFSLPRLAVSFFFFSYSTRLTFFLSQLRLSLSTIIFLFFLALRNGSGKRAIRTGGENFSNFFSSQFSGHNRDKHVHNHLCIFGLFNHSRYMLMC